MLTSWKVIVQYTGFSRNTLKRLKEETASLGCAFVLITAEKETNYTGGGTKGWGNVQDQKKGLAYKY